MPKHTPAKCGWCPRELILSSAYILRPRRPTRRVVQREGLAEPRRFCTSAAVWSLKIAAVEYRSLHACIKDQARGCRAINAPQGGEGEDVAATLSGSYITGSDSPRGPYRLGQRRTVELEPSGRCTTDAAVRTGPRQKICPAEKSGAQTTSAGNEPTYSRITADTRRTIICAKLLSTAGPV